MKKKREILSACNSGGDFVDGWYCQYKAEYVTLKTLGMSDSSPPVGFHTSLSFSSFFQNTIIPHWFPLSNIKVDQSKKLSMLQMKRNKKGGVDWDDRLKNSSALPPLQSNPHALPVTPRNCFCVCVIGGGISGLACALELLRTEDIEEKPNLEVMIVEGR